MVNNLDRKHIEAESTFTPRGTAGIPPLEPLHDPVNPPHYRSLGLYSALHVTEIWGLGYHLGQAVKYIQRAGKKPGVDEITDLKKAIWYIQRHIHLLDPKEFDPANDAAFRNTESAQIGDKVAST